MICNQCERPSKKITEVFMPEERTFAILAFAQALRTMNSQITDPKNREVCSSLLTKFLLSYSADKRDSLLSILRRDVNLPINMDNCIHNSGGGLRLV